MIKDNLLEIKSTFPPGKEVELVAVSKFHSTAAIMEAYLAGQRVFGESRVQELEQKARQLPADIKWHFIGHLQTNKVARLLKIPNLTLIESVDSTRLLDFIDAEAVKLGITAHILMEIHVAQEETKSGFTTPEIEEWFARRNFEQLKATHIHGVMGMASNTDNPERIAADFREIYRCFEKIKKNIAPDLTRFDIVSMGMSNDYDIAIKEGATAVRIGSSIFGGRL